MLFFVAPQRRAQKSLIRVLHFASAAWYTLAAKSFENTVLEQKEQHPIYGLYHPTPCKSH
jgi:hypothetical protein